MFEELMTRAGARFRRVEPRRRARAFVLGLLAEPRLSSPGGLQSCDGDIIAILRGRTMACTGPAPG